MLNIVNPSGYLIFFLKSVIDFTVTRILDRLFSLQRERDTGKGFRQQINYNGEFKKKFTP